MAPVLAEAVRQAAAERRALRIVGGDTKPLYGRPVDGERLELRGHRGIVDYDPAELVITARAGTPLAAIEARLTAEGQRLSFEPPRLGASSTIGGVVAAGLAGPRRPFAGAVRDSLLGVRVLDGRGRALSFGGRVFKNVAGFDLFRPMAGALGTLGVILEVSLRVAPAPRREIALALEAPSAAARAFVAERLRTAMPLSGAFHDGRRLILRLAGGEAGVQTARSGVGGEEIGLAAWDAIRDLAHPALAAPGPLWRLSLPPAAPIPPVGELLCWDWAGAHAWIGGDLEPERVWSAARAAGGHAMLFRGAAPGAEVFQPLASPLMALHRRLKAALDPAGVLNPGRLYRDL